MAGTSVLGLAIAAPRLYRAVAGFSGCARTSDPLGQEYIKTVIGLRGDADVTNMWGPLDGPGWKANDPISTPASCAAPDEGVSDRRYRSARAVRPV